MDLINANELRTHSEYNEKRLKLKISHFCPLDGLERDANCKRIVVTTDVSQTQQTIAKYLVIVLYGSYAKTPFKKSSLKIGQILTLQRFHTSIMPKNKTFKCNGVLIKDFYECLVLVKSEYKPIIKMIVSLREDIPDNCFIPIQDNDSFDSSSETNEQMIAVKEKTTKTKEQHNDRQTGLPPKKRLKFDSSSDEEMATDEGINTPKRTLRSTSSVENKLENNNKSDKQSKPNKTIIKTVVISPKKSNYSNNNNNNNNESMNCTSNTNNNSLETNRKYEYKSLLEVHNLMPVSGKTYVHIYGILKYRDFKNKTINLRDEKVYSFTIQLKPGNSNRSYPGFRTGDIIRIHRLLLATNSMDRICTDPKDIVAFEAFQDCEAFTPIKTSLNPSFDEFDKQRKLELEEWFSDELINNSLSEMKRVVGYVDIVAQVISINSYQNRSVLQVWDTSKPALKTYRYHYSNDTKVCDNEELLRIIEENEMSVYVTVFDEHSMDVINLKPFDIIVLFNVNIKIDQRNTDCHSLTLNSGYNFGKCIRVVKQNSVLGKKIISKIEEYKVMSAVNTSGNSNEEIDFPSQSLPNDSQTLEQIEREIAISAEEEEMSFSELGRDFEINFDQVIDTLENDETYLPSVILVDIPNRTILIDELLTTGVDKQLYKVKARVMCYLPSNDKKDVISVLCTNEECQQILTLRQFMAKDPLIEPMITSSKDDKLTLNCLKCSQSSCILVFKLILVLEDTKHDKVMAELFGHNAELFLKGTPEEMIKNPSKWYFVESLLSFICAKISSLDSQDSNNVLINWILQPSRVDSNNLFYQIRAAIAIEKADKCVGFNSG